jgi:GNAT superfamily N-acetyltransferase
MKISVLKTELKNILALRGLFLQETNFQIRYNACHERSWTDPYLLLQDDVAVGYASIKGKDDLNKRDAVFEYFLIPACRTGTYLFFHQLAQVSQARFIECQSNDLILSSLLFQYTKNIVSDTILFKDRSVTEFAMQRTVFRKRREDDMIFEHHSEPVGEFVLELNREIVATGGFLIHYNYPFADHYMEVMEDQRQKGFGSLILQEVKKRSYLAGRVPAARCNIGNNASKATLIRAGFEITGFMLTGEIML